MRHWRRPWRSTSRFAFISTSLFGKSASRRQKLAVTASSATAARFPPPRPPLQIRKQTLGPPSPFIAIPTQFVLTHLQLGEHVFHCAQF
jgi:hypothetical protein